MSESGTDHDLLTEIDGVGDGLANRLLAHCGSGRQVANRASRYWGDLLNVDGVSEELAESMFDRMLDAGVYKDLSGREVRDEHR